MSFISSDVILWITVVDIPVLGTLSGVMWRLYVSTEKEAMRIERVLDVRCDQLRDALAAFKLEVAKTYASQRDLRALEHRLVEHLLRIEGKLDTTALKTAGLEARKLP